MKMNPWFKTAMALCLVVGPIYWLMFTNDGQRRSDTVMLWLSGADSVDLDLQRLNPGYGLEQLRQVYPKLDWQCREQTTADTGRGRACSSPLGSYNSIPAYRIAFHFDDDQLARLRIDYRRRYHQALLTQLRRQLGKPVTPASGAGGRAAEVIEWRLAHGLVVLKRELRDQDEPALFWLARPLPAPATGINGDG